MNNAVEFVVLSLAAWRLTSLLVNEDGPGDMFARFRKFVGVYYDEYSQKQGRNWIAKGLCCFWCASVWVSAGVAVFASFSVNIHTYVVGAFALSAAAILIDRVSDG